MALVSWNDVWREFWKGEGLFSPKKITLRGGNPWSNIGSSTPANFTWVTKNELKNHYKEIYEDYSRRHPFTPSAKALTNPGLMQMEKEIWAKKCHKYCISQEPKRYAEMLYKETYGQKADVKPRNGAFVTSSWITGIKIPNQNQMQINLGGKWYTYNCPKGAQAKLLQVRSIGHEIAKARKGQSEFLHRIPGYK